MKMGAAGDGKIALVMVLSFASNSPRGIVL